MHTADHYFDKKLEQQFQQNRLRKLRSKSIVIDFSSNDYLGLSQEEFSVYTKGSTGSRLLTGNTPEIGELEKKLAEFYSSPEALLFPTGFQANIGLLSILGERADTYLMDEQIHASMKVGARLSNATSWKFKHNNLIDLEEKLLKAKGTVWVFVEALYSMSGSIAPLKEIAELCQKYQAHLIVDEAHSNGIYGEKGQGLTLAMGLENKVAARVMTFGKAFGAEGAVVLGSQSLKNYFINFSYPFIYSTAPSLGFLNALRRQLNEVKKANQQRTLLFQNIALFQQLIHQSSLKWAKSSSPIQALIVGGAEKTKKLAQQLQEKGFSVFPILSPTIPIGEEQIRFCIHSYNTTEEISSLFQTLNSIT